MAGIPPRSTSYTPAGSGRPEIALVAEPEVDTSASIGNLVKDATVHLSTLVRSEIELAKMEITETVKTGAKGGIFFIVAGMIGLFSLFFFWFMVAWILAIWLPTWAAFTIVFVVMLLTAGALAFLGYRKVKQVKKPELTINSLTETATALKAAASNSDTPVANR